MTRDEYLAVLGSAAATRTQVGAVIGEFARLGVVDRTERLAMCAELFGLGELGSMRDLTMGQVGQLIRMLRDVRDRTALPGVTTAAAAADDRADLPVVTAAAAVDSDDQGADDDAGGRRSAGGAITRFLVAFAVSRERWNAALRISRDTELAAHEGT